MWHVLLQEAVTNLKGVGEKTGNDLAEMNIYTIEDLLFHFPYRYEFFEVKPLSELIHDDTVTIVGKVVTIPQVIYGKVPRLIFNVEVDHAVVRSVMFQRTFAKNQLKPNTVVTLTGKWDAHRLQITVSHYKIGKPPSTQQIHPVYSAKGKLTSQRLKILIQDALKKYADEVEEIIPPSYLKAYYLPERKKALQMIHQPQNRDALKHARRRFVYEELLLFQLKMQLYKKQRKQARNGIAHQIDIAQLEQLLATLPFTLTNDQQQALEEILADMQSDKQMYRLLQGDVGSGKTVVAALSLFAAVTAGFQGALMVPTEILAEQHFHSLQQLLGEKVKIALLTSSVKGKKRKEILTGLQNHSLSIIVGTHALIQDEVQFANLSLVIIDEQHRFGVAQRKSLRQKGHDPDVLLMTATPIPRTLAITAFGDLDISLIKEMPQGRKPVLTYVVQEQMLDRVLRFIAKKIHDGEQAYVVTPLIEESEAFDYENVIDLYHKLITYYPETIRIGLLHGRLPSDEKDVIMKQFVNHEIDILVTTTVIEVGVNVPNATIMVIYDAERFGLSQLHQLRGRVGRGDKQSYCILIADPKGEDGKERMRIIQETSDGFALAEADLRLRGPGDFFGTKQSGLPEFKIADLVEDYKALEVARNDALQIISENRLETDPAYKHLKAFLEKEMIDAFD